ncbi:ribosome biogenesis/translation initiation ATPase RLI [Candidatus Pyrohabitans sp.]
MRIAVIDHSRCQPRKCSLECVKFCPGVRMGEETIVMDDTRGKPLISETLCTGCGICVKKCPFEAITVVNLPDELDSNKVHQYGENGFRIFRLPYPKEGAVTGLIGENGIGKTTILRILAGELIPNFGTQEASKERVLEHFAGTQLHDYFKALYAGELRAVHKPQYVDALPKIVSGEVGELLSRVDERGEMRQVVERLELEHALPRELSRLSGGELQRVAIAAALLREGDIYIFDEPSSYLDVEQRLKVGRVIRELAQEKRVLLVEHDLVVLDYLADYVHVLYGRAGAYGIVSHPRSVRQGINAYLNGYLREENVRIRAEPVRFEVRPPVVAREENLLLSFSRLCKSYDGFELCVAQGEFYRGEVVGVLGPNATGKTTFVKMLAGVVEPDVGEVSISARVAYKPQYIKPEFTGTVLEAVARVATPGDAFFENEVARPLNLKSLYDLRVKELSGGELQRVAIALCLAREAEVYLLDEPSAYLDVEQRLRVAKMIRRVMEKREALAIVVDHDILFIDYISDRAMVFSGNPGVRGEATSPLEMRLAMNTFLREMGITFRRDPETGRPRANKPGSVKDREQKAKGEYYYL